MRKGGEKEHALVSIAIIEYRSKPALFRGRHSSTLIRRTDELLPSHRLRLSLPHPPGLLCHTHTRQSSKVSLVGLRTYPTAATGRDRSTDIIRVRHRSESAPKLLTVACTLLVYERRAVEVVVASLYAVGERGGWRGD